MSRPVLSRAPWTVTALIDALEPAPVPYAFGGAIPKDIVDLKTLLRIQGAALDVAFVRCEIAEMMGEKDERVARWDALIEARLGARP